MSEVEVWDITDETGAPAEAPEFGWTRIGRTVVHRGRVTLVEHDVVLPDGSRSRFEVDESAPYSVATLVVDGADLLLAREYRYPIDRWIYDLPGGGPRPGEHPLDAARRELEEELGLIATDLRHLHTFFMNPGRAAWPTHLFISTRALESGRADRTDPTEQVRIARIPLDELDGLLRRGLIVDPALIVARSMTAARGDLPPIAAGQ